MGLVVGQEHRHNSGEILIMSILTDYHLPERAENLTGMRFGMLAVIRFDRRERFPGSSRIFWLCKCDCGNVTSVPTATLKNGSTRSCGCGVAIAARTHGFARKGPQIHPLYRAFQAMRQRCKQTSGEVYERYAARGITVDPRWTTFEEFYKDMGPSWKRGLSLGRIDNDKGYSPENCRWETAHQQNANRRGLHKLTFRGETLTLMDWSRKLGLGYACMLLRIKKGLSVEEILSPSLRKGRSLIQFHAHCL